MDFIIRLRSEAKAILAALDGEEYRPDRYDAPMSQLEFEEKLKRFREEMKEFLREPGADIR